MLDYFVRSLESIFILLLNSQGAAATDLQETLPFEATQVCEAFVAAGQASPQQSSERMVSTPYYSPTEIQKGKAIPKVSTFGDVPCPATRSPEPPAASAVKEETPPRNDTGKGSVTTKDADRLSTMLDSEARSRNTLKHFMID